MRNADSSQGKNLAPTEGEIMKRWWQWTGNSLGKTTHNTWQHYNANPAIEPPREKVKIDRPRITSQSNLEAGVKVLGKNWNKGREDCTG